MEDCVRAVLTGVAIGVFTTAVVKVNLFVIDKLATINALAIETAVGMGVFSLETIKMRSEFRVQSSEFVGADSRTHLQQQKLSNRRLLPLRRLSLHLL